VSLESAGRNKQKTDITPKNMNVLFKPTAESFMMLIESGLKFLNIVAWKAVLN
jgi:hypothetical protein